MLMKKSMLLLAFFMTTSAFADMTYTTSKGIVLTEVEKQGFGLAWEDPSGMIWSADHGVFSNNGTDEGKTVLVSPAVESCVAIGGQLPSSADFVRLFSYFHTDSDVPNGYDWSDAEVIDLLTVLPDVTTHLFWTSSIGDLGDSTAAVAHLTLLADGHYSASTGQIIRTAPMSVVCVSY